MHGRDGLDGQSGQGFDVKIHTSCAGDVTQGGVLSYALRYTVVEYTSGSVLVSCSVADGVGTSSRTDFFDAQQVGATSHACLVQASDGADSFGYWLFELGPTGYAATYKDTGSSNDGFVFEFDGTSAQDSGCTIREI
jgi:hypothetical protein